jgi:predicted secreted hydrolase
MGTVRYTQSAGIPHLSMSEEFLSHRKLPEWWYTTGYVTDESGKMFSYQFTLAKLRVYGLKLYFLITALTDFETGKHYYAQQSIFSDKKVSITPERVGVEGMSEMTFAEKHYGLHMASDGYSLDLTMDLNKPPVWHCEDGKLMMGIENNHTFYWSATNLAVSGKLILNGKEHHISGKGWFDKQGGPYNFLDRRTQWEWFSLRFFDNEEVMLFSFPHDNYRDGTYIEKSGKYTRFNNYTITPTRFTEAHGLKFSSGWKMTLKGLKDEEYTITPKLEGQLNFFFFELLADITDREGKVVGYCFVELLPGVYNEKNTTMALFSRQK